MSGIGENDLYQAVLQAKDEARVELLETISRGLDRAERELFDEMFRTDMQLRRSDPETAAKFARSRSGRRLGMIRHTLQEVMDAEKKQDRELRYSGLDRHRDIRLEGRTWSHLEVDPEDDGC